MLLLKGTCWFSKRIVVYNLSVFWYRTDKDLWPVILRHTRLRLVVVQPAISFVTDTFGSKMTRAEYGSSLLLWTLQYPQMPKTYLDSSTAGCKCYSIKWTGWTWLRI